MDQHINSKGIMFYLSMIITIVSVLFYQILQKGISNNVNPAVSLIISYTIAILVSIILYFIIPSGEGFINSIKKANLASYLLGVAVVGIEIGFLLIYRNGWKLGLAAPFSSSITNILLISIGLLVYKEHLTGMNMLGLFFCIVGIILISYKQ
jgi:drug/metabolite transporter (DMT)-like permease